jgi:type I restriction enzyme S subunit
MGCNAYQAEFDASCPDGWKVAPLTDVVFFQEGPGILAKDFHDAGIPLIRLKGVEGDYVTKEGCNYLSPDRVATKWNHFKLDVGDLVISTSASFGRVSVVTEETAGAIIYTGLIRFRPTTPDLDSSFLRAFLSSQTFLQQVEAMASGSVIRHFGPMHLKQMAIQLPPLNEQTAIGAISDAIAERLRSLRQTNTTLEAIAQALFKSWFVDFDPVHAKAEGREPEAMDPATAALFPSELEESELGLIPKGWRVCSIYDIANVKYGAPFASSKFNTEGNGLPLVRIRDLRAEQPGVWTPEVHPKGYLIQPGDIIVGMDGEFRAHLWGGEPAWMNQRVCVFHSIAPHCNVFVRNAIAAPLAQVEATETATTVIHLGKGDIDQFKVVAPSDEVAAAFAACSQPLYDKIVSAKQQARNLADLRDTLLPRLISGKLRLPEATEVAEEDVA